MSSSLRLSPCTAFGQLSSDSMTTAAPLIYRASASTDRRWDEMEGIGGRDLYDHAINAHLTADGFYSSRQRERTTMEQQTRPWVEGGGAIIRRREGMLLLDKKEAGGMRDWLEREAKRGFGRRREGRGCGFRRSDADFQFGGKPDQNSPISDRSISHAEERARTKQRVRIQVMAVDVTIRKVDEVAHLISETGVDKDEFLWKYFRNPRRSPSGMKDMHLSERSSRPTPIRMHQRLLALRKNFKRGDFGGSKIHGSELDAVNDGKPLPIYPLWFCLAVHGTRL
ncbi:hypothetical protein F5146DRAFT_1126291 [Armillaria mellea]|nr:hypothetical protein F5146DRAFT_1126291 [Armillaria mellea]